MATTTLLDAQNPWWLAVVLALIGAAGGAWLAASITSRKDLEQQRRDIEQQARARMLDAADAFVRAASAAAAGLRSLEPAAQRRAPVMGLWRRLTLGLTKPVPSAAGGAVELERLSQSWVLLGDVSRELRRVELIFGLAAGGPASKAVADAKRTEQRLHDGWAALDRYDRLSRTSEAGAVVRRRRVVEAFADIFVNGGFVRLAGRARGLAATAGDQPARQPPDAVLNVNPPLDEARDAARSARFEAEDALSAFSAGVALTLLALPIRYEYDVWFEVGTDEEIRPVLRRRTRLARAFAQLRS